MRFFEPKDYETVCEWWKGYNSPCIPFEALPKNGFIIDGLCAGFLYSTDSSFALLEFVVGNPAAEKEARGKALDQLIMGLAGLAKEYGFKLLFTTSNIKNLTNRYKELGFTETNSDVSHFIRSL